MSLADFKEKVLRPVYLPASFVLGALTLGLRTATINFEFGDDVSAPGLLSTQQRRVLPACIVAFLHAQCTPGLWWQAGAQAQQPHHQNSTAPATLACCSSCVQPAVPKLLAMACAYTACILDSQALTPCPCPAPAQPVSFIGCTLSTGLLTMALAWVLFDFVDDPPEGGNFSSPK